MFGPDGGLVANAPHIPVHLGSMQETVQYQVRKWNANTAAMQFAHIYFLAWLINFPAGDVLLFGPMERGCESQVECTSKH